MVKVNDEIYKQGDIPGCFYILKSCTCDVIVHGKKKENLQKENIFGDSDLLCGTDKEYTVKASIDCYVWVIEKKL